MQLPAFHPRRRRGRCRRRSTGRCWRLQRERLALLADGLSAAQVVEHHAAAPGALFSAGIWVESFGAESFVLSDAGD